MGRYEMNQLRQKYDELHGLLCDYDQEEHYIELIHKTVQEIIDDLPQGNRIGFRPCGAPTAWLIQNFDFSHVDIIGIFDKNANGSDGCGYPVYDADGAEVRNVDIFIVTSFNWHSEILAEMGKKHYEVLDIYCELEKRAVYLCASLETYIKGTHTILHDYLMRWKKADEGVREEALKSLLTAACEAKDFYMLNDLCEKHKEEYAFCCECQKKYNELHKLIKNLVAKREQKDILWYWVDAVPYKWKHLFEKLNKLSDEGVCFNQAYTATPFTFQSFRTCFSGVLPLDDCEKSMEKLGCETSDLIRYLNGNDYAICRIGARSSMWEEECIQEEFLIDMPQANISCNTLLWDMLCRLISLTKPAFLIAHLVTETHAPVICAEMEKMENVYLSDDRETQFAISADYVDKRVFWYSDLLRRGRRIQIFMSDHGEHITQKNSDIFWTQQKLHACCFVIGMGIQPRQEERIFSYTKFIEFIKWLIEPDKYRYEECLTDYAVFQDTDFYSEELINRYIKSGKAEQALAYRGALDGRYKYVINSMGKEFFYRIVKDEDIEINKEENMEDFDRLKKLAGVSFPNLLRFHRYQHIYKIYAAIEGASHAEGE